MATETVTDYHVETREEEYEIYYCDHCGANLGRKGEVAPLVVAINPRWGVDISPLESWAETVGETLKAEVGISSRISRTDVDYMIRGMDLPDIRDHIVTDRHEEWCDECIEQQFDADVSGYERVRGLSDMYVAREPETQPQAARYGTMTAACVPVLFALSLLGWTVPSVVFALITAYFAVLTIIAHLRGATEEVD